MRIFYIKSKEHLLQLIKASVNATEPEAIVILYGFYAKGDNKPDSDVDLLILVN